MKDISSRISFLLKPFSFVDAVTPPTINTPIGEIKAEYCSTVEYKIDANAYTDAEDGNVGKGNLELELLDASSRRISPTNEQVPVQLINSTIYIVPVSSVASTQLNLILRVKDTEQYFVDDRFVITFNGKVTQYQMMFKFIYSKLETGQELNILDHFNFLRQLNTLDTWRNKKMSIIKIRSVQSSSKEVSLIDCSMTTSVCPVTEILEMVNHIKDQNPGPYFALGFEIALTSVGLKPSQFSWDKFSQCKQSITGVPSRNGDITFWTLAGIGTLQQTKVVQIEIPDNAFTYESVKQSAMTIHFNPSQSEIALNFTNFWIGVELEGTTWVIYAITTERLYKYIENQMNYFNYQGDLFAMAFIQATIPISAGEESNDYYLRIQNTTKPINNYIVHFDVNILGIARQVYPKQISMLLSKLYQSFGNEYMDLIYVNDYVIHSIDGRNGIATVTWSLLVKKCDFNQINFLRSKMFQNADADSKISSNMKLYMKNEFELNAIRETLRGDCSLTRPKQRKPVGPFQVSYCGINTFLIPDDAFTDDEDGNLQRMKVTLLTSQKTELTETNIVQFDKTTKTIYALLPSTYQPPLQRKINYILQVEDMSGLSIQSTITFNILDDKIDSSYAIKMVTKFSPLENDSFSQRAGLALAFKISSFVNDDSGRGFYLVDSQISSDGNKVLTFSNCTWSTIRCDVVNLKNYKDNLLATPDLFRSTLTMSPEFQVVTVTEIVKAPCDKDEPPQVANPLKTIIVSTCKTFRMTIPKDTFTDKEQGNARSLKLSITLVATQFGSAEMLLYNEQSQSIEIVATQDDHEVQSYEVKAQDINSNLATDILTVRIVKWSQEPSHIITFQFRIVNNEFTSLVQLYSTIRAKFKSFFGDGVSTNTFQIVKTEQLSIGYGTDSVHLIQWTNCTLPRDECDEEKVKYVKDQLLPDDESSARLVREFQDKFFILSLEFKRNGVCDPNPPKVSQKIPDQEIGFCGPMIYQIPENTFKDNSDGNSRKLQLSMVFLNDTQVKNTYFIQFDSTEQTVYGVLNHKKQQGTSVADTDSIQLKIIATNSKGKSVSTPLTIKIKDEPRKISKIFKMAFSWRSRQGTNIVKLFANTATQLSKFFGWTNSDFYVYDYNYMSRVSTLFLVDASFTSCKAKYSPCDKDFINGVTEKAISNGQPSDELRNALPSEYKILSFRSLNIGTECLPRPKPPTYINPFQPFRLPACQSFTRDFPRDTFNDEEDATLNYLVTKVNQRFVSIESSWIWIDSTKHQFFGIASDDLLSSESSSQQNVTVRAVDSHGKFVEGSVLVTLSRAEVNEFYTFETKFKVNDNTLINDNLRIKISFTESLNKFFGNQPATSIVSLQPGDGSTVGSYVMKWRHCIIPKSCLNPTVLQVETSKIIRDDNKPTNEFQKALSDFEVTEVSLHVSSKCNSTLNPPQAERNPLVLNLPVCGGFVYTIDKKLFSDRENGDTRNLQVILSMGNGKEIHSTYGWMEYSVTTQTLTGYPTMFEAELFNQLNRTFKLTATDETGLEEIIDVIIKFQAIRETPKYFYVLGTSLTQTTIISELTKRFWIAQGISSYLNQTTTRDVGLKEMTKGEYRFFNCSIRFEPCDWASFQTVKTLLSGNGNVPNEDLQKGLYPKYQITYVSTEYELPCSNDGSNPPDVIQKIQDLTIRLCTWMDWSLPKETFYDLEDGDTRNLAISIKDEGTDTNIENWIYFNPKDQRLWINALATVARKQPNGYKFSVIATDSSSRTAGTEMLVKFVGPYSILEECKLKMTIELRKDFSTVNKVSIMRLIMQKMAIYFQIQLDEIGAVDYQIDIQKKQVVLFWSYCSNRYKSKEYDMDSKKLEVDYYNLIVKILLKLYQNDRKTVQDEFIRSFGNDFVVTDVKPEFTGRCTNLPPIVYPGTPDFQMTVHYFGYAAEFYENTIFYDFEDGWAYQLVLVVSETRHQGLKTMIDSWINVDTVSHNVYAVADNRVRNLSSFKWIFYLIAEDTGGKQATIPIHVNIQRSTLTISPFQFRFIYTYQGAPSQVYVNQTIYLMEKFALFYQINTNNMVILTFNSIVGNLNLRVIEWSTLQENCKSSVYTTTQSLRSHTDMLLNKKFINHFKNLMILKRIIIDGSCEKYSSPIIRSNITTQTIQFCSIFKYQIPKNLFYDPVDGDIPNLKIRLLDNDYKTVSTASWLQIDLSSLELYGIAVRRQFRIKSTFKFNIQVTNGGNLTRSSAFTVIMKDQPYTTDCPITMNFTYHYLSEETKNIDVLIQVVNMIQNFYGDQTINIKVINFVRTDKNFHIVWSNCSSTFRSSASSSAKYGYTEAERQKIKLVFERIYINGNTRFEFRSYMASFIEISHLSVSYCCIEQSPVAKQSTIRLHGQICQPIRETLAEDTFVDKCDGSTSDLILKLLNKDSTQSVGIDEWVQLDKHHKLVYGVVTEEVAQNAPLTGYRYDLIAYDYSGRSAKVNLIINIIGGQIPDYQTYFVTGFTNVYAETIPTASILFKTQQSISHLLDPENGKSGEIFIKRFQYPEVVTWTRCSITPPDCDHTKIIETLNEMQVRVYDAKPNTIFVDSSAHEMRPYWIQSFIRNRKCGSGITTITTNTEIPREINITTCGLFTYQIPSNLFIPSEPMDPRYLVLTAEFGDGRQFKESSLVQFNQPRQMLYGYAVSQHFITTSSTSNVQIKVTATHPTSGQTASANLRLNFPNKTISDKMNGSICKINTTLISKYREAYSDVQILSRFSQLMSSYLKISAVAGIEIFSYHRSRNHMWSILWADCKSTYSLYQNQNSLEYHNKIETYIQSLAQNDKVHPDLTRFVTNVNSQFEIQHNTFSAQCSRPSNNPPSPNRPVSIQLPSCGTFEIQIAEDTFLDSSDGDTRNLKLELRFTDGDQKVVPDSHWITLNQSQYLIGIVNSDIIKNQPSDGYKFNLVAMDSVGLTSTIVISVNHNRKELPAPIIRFNNIGKMIPGIDIAETKIRILKSLASYVNERSYNHVKYTDYYFDNIVRNSESIRFTVSLCSNCNPFKMDPFRYMDTNIAKMIFKDVVSIESSNIQIANNVDKLTATCNTLATNQLPFKIPIQDCARNVYDLVKHLSTGIQKQLKYELLDPVYKQPFPWDHFVWLNKKDLTIETFLSQEMRQYKKNTHNLILAVTFVFLPQKPVHFNFMLNISGMASVPKATDFSVTVQSIRNTEKPDGYFISQSLTRIQNIIGNGVNITFNGFQRISLKPFQYKTSWMVCVSKDDKVCQSNIINNVTESIVDDKLNPTSEMIKEFSPDIVLKSESRCQNRPPTSLATYNITIGECGHFEHRLPGSIALDNEDGDLISMKIQLKNTDGTMLSRSSWVQFDDNTKSLSIVANKVTYQNIILVPVSFMLVITDSRSKSTQTQLWINAKGNGSSLGFYSNTMTFSSNLGQSSTFNQIQLMFLSRIAGIVKDTSLATYRIVDFEKLSSTEERYRIKYDAYCILGPTVCPATSNQMASTEKLIQNELGNPTNILIANLAPSFNILNLGITRSFTIDQRPVSSKNIERFIIKSCCDTKSVCLRKNTFTDLEDGDIDNLSLKLTSHDGKAMTSNHLIRLIDNCLYLVPSQDVTLAGVYNFVLTANDKCNNTDFMVIEVEVLKSHKQQQFGLTFHAKTTGKVLNFKDYFNIKTELERYLETTESFTVIKSDKQSVTFGYCKLNPENCDLNSARNFAQRVSNGKPEITENLKKYGIELAGISTTRKGLCKEPLFPPPKSKYTELKFNVTYCSKFEIQIPQDTFFNDQGLRTKDYKLKLLTSKFDAPTTHGSWIQLNEQSQTIYGYPRTFSHQNQFNFTIQAKKNASDRGLKLPVFVTVTGEKPSTDYQLIVNVNMISQSTSPDVFYEIMLIDYLEKFFSQGPLATLTSIQNSLTTTKRFVLAFCRARQKPCDCMLVNRTSSMMPGENGLESRRINNMFDITTVKTMFYGQCNNTKQPQVKKTPSLYYFEIAEGRFFRSEIQKDLFTDHEDGEMSNLSLSITDVQDRQLDRFSWMKIDNSKQNPSICGVYTLNEQQNTISTTSGQLYKFSMVAKDGCGKQASTQFTFRFSRSVRSAKSYCLIIDIQYNQFVVDCSLIETLISIIAQTINRPKSDVIISKIQAAPEDNQKTLFEWVTANNQDIQCNIGTNNRTSVAFHQKGILKQLFTNAMKQAGLPVSGLKLKCKIALRSTQNPGFPWWAIFLIVLLLSLFILLWLSWLLIPRSCPSCCCSILCPVFCTKQGIFSSIGVRKYVDPIHSDSSVSPIPMPNDGDIVDGRFPKLNRLSIDSGHYSDHHLELPPLYNHKQRPLDNSTTSSTIKRISTTTLTTDTRKQQDTRSSLAKKNYYKTIDDNDINIEFIEEDDDDKQPKQLPISESWYDPRQTTNRQRYNIDEYLTNTTNNDTRYRRDSRVTQQFRKARIRGRIGSQKIVLIKRRKHNDQTQLHRRVNSYLVNRRESRKKISKADVQRKISLLSHQTFNNDNKRYHVTDNNHRRKSVDQLLEKRFINPNRNSLHQRNRIIYTVPSTGDEDDSTLIGYTSDTSDRSYYVIRRRRKDIVPS